MDFPGARLSLPIRWFPFQRPGAALPTALPDCHLVRTAIPRLPSDDSLGVFHYSQTISLASFADTVSRSNHNRSLAGEPAAYSPIRHAHARQATSAHSVHGSRPGSTAIQVSTLSRTQVEVPQREYARPREQVSTTAGSASPCHWGTPYGRKRGESALPAQHPPQTGRLQQAPGVSQLCPLKDF